MGSDYGPDAFVEMIRVIAAGGTAGASRGMSQVATLPDPMAYFVDALYRTDHPSVSISDADVRAQSVRILTNGMLAGDIPASDKAYLEQFVAARTGLAPAEAETRVDAVLAQTKTAEAKTRKAVDEARKAAMYLSIFTALSMLIGAFIAGVATALGGQQRDAF